MQNIKLASIQCILKPVNTTNSQNHKICFNSTLNQLFSLTSCNETSKFDLIWSKIDKTCENEAIYSNTFSLSSSNSPSRPLRSVSSDHLVSLDYIPSIESLCFTTHYGLVGLYKIYKKVADTAGYLEEGISSASWCPNKQVLALTSITGEMWLMTASFDIIKQNSFTKELSFSAINWRSDGKFFSVLANKRVFVFDCDGNSVSKSETFDSECVSDVGWNRESNLINVSDVLNEIGLMKLRFIECNGLFHGEAKVSLPISKGKKLTHFNFLNIISRKINFLIKQKEKSKIRLSFNRNSDILAIFCEKFVAFCVEQNSKMYLKRIIRFCYILYKFWPV